TQILMNELNGHRAFSYSRSHALDGPVADVAYRKDARDVGFEQAWIAIERPSMSLLPIAGEVGAGEHEAALIAFDRVLQPIGLRFRPNEDEQRDGRNLLHGSSGIAGNRDRFQAVFAMSFDDTRL